MSSNLSDNHLGKLSQDQIHMKFLFLGNGLCCLSYGHLGAKIWKQYLKATKRVQHPGLNILVSDLYNASLTIIILFLVIDMNTLRDVLFRQFHMLKRNNSSTILILLIRQICIRIVYVFNFNR